MANRNAGLAVVITGDTKSLEKATHRASGSLDKLGRQTAVTARVTQRGFSGIGIAARGAAAATVGLTAGVGFLVKQYEESRKVGAQTNAVLKSTGGAANVSAKHVAELATAISKKTGVDDEAIQSGENLLLTFTKVRDEVGKGNDIFSRATQTVTDMSVALGQDTKSSAIQLGKALNDPIKGVTALQRVGVSFTQQQKDQIKTLVESGRTLDAQKLILKELNTEFGGSAEAQAGGFDKLKVSAGNLAESVGGALAPSLSKAADGVSKFLDKVVEGKGPIGGFLASVGKLPGKVKAQFDKLKDQKGGAGAAIGAMIVQGISDIDWSALGQKVSAGFTKALKVGKSIASNILDAIGQVPWGTVGTKISDGFDAALNLGDKLPGAIEKGLGDAVSHVNGRQVLGKLVDIVGEAIDALFSPSFWIDHFKAILSVVTLVIPVGKLLKIPGFSTLYRFISKPVFQAIGALGRGMLSLFGKASAEAGIRFLAELETVAPKTAGFLLSVVTKGGKALSGLPGRLGGIATDAAEAVARKLGDGLGGIIGAVAKWGIRSVGRLRAAIPGFVKVAAAIGAAVVAGILSGLGQLGHQIRSKIVDSLKFAVDIGSSPVSIGKAIGNAIAKGVGIGDGAGKLGPIGGGKFSGGLHGARPEMGAFASIANRFGLGISSGRTDHSKYTSSGNLSYHGSGEALDFSNGVSTPQEMSFARYMVSNFSNRLAELIFTPLGFSIKDGRRVAPIAASDHFDHVHLAVDLGAPGVGDGPGRRRFTGDGIGQIKGLWTRAGGRKGAASMAAAIAMAESSGQPGVTHRNADGSIDRGLWQINSVHGALSTTNRLGNARAAVGISHNGRDWSPWTTFTSGAYKKFLTAARRGGSSGGGASSGGGMAGVVGGGFGAGAPGVSGNILSTGFGAGVSQFTPDPDFSVPTELDYLNAASSQAGLTAGTADDLSAATALRDYYQGTYNQALRSGDPRIIGPAAEALKQATDAVNGLTESITAANRIAEERAAIEKELVTNQQAILALTKSQGPQLIAGLAAILSGSVGGKIALGFQTPGFAGTAGGVRY